MDIVQQLINEADNSNGFVAAAAAVRNHIMRGRDPEVTHSLMVTLAMRGHVLISQGHDHVVISNAVARVLATEPTQPRTVGALR